jgi:23S rRNA pseudouridine1911/1915/1917 synthase
MEPSRVAPELRGERLDKVVSHAVGVGRQKARELVEHGKVTLDGKAVRLSSHRVRGGEVLRVAFQSEEKAAPAVRVLHEDAALLVVEKPAGLPSEPTRDPRRPSVLGSFERAVGLPHRLDLDTSGVLVLAKTKEALAALNVAFESRAAHKVYEALVHGPFEGERMIESFLAPAGERAGKERFASVHSGGKKAITLVRALRAEGEQARVACEPQTGRTHQIRVHLAEAGHPIVGDELYGAPRGEHARLGRFLLHARVLEVEHPLTGERVRFESAVPF